MDDGRGFGSELVTLDFIPCLPRLIPAVGGNFSAEGDFYATQASFGGMLRREGGT